MRVILHRQGAAVSIHHPPTDRRNVDTGPDASGREQVPEVVMGSLRTVSVRRLQYRMSRRPANVRVRASDTDPMGSRLLTGVEGRRVHCRGLPDGSGGRIDSRWRVGPWPSARRASRSTRTTLASSPPPTGPSPAQMGVRYRVPTYFLHGQLVSLDGAERLISHRESFALVTEPVLAAQLRSCHGFSRDMRPSTRQPQAGSARFFHGRARGVQPITRIICHLSCRFVPAGFRLSKR